MLPTQDLRVTYPLLSSAVGALVCRPTLTDWLLVRLMCCTKESAWSRYKYKVGKAASTILVVVTVIVLVVAVIEAETTRVGSACC